MKVLIFCSAVIPAAGIAVELLTRKSYGKLPPGTLYVPAVCRVCWHIISLALAMMGLLPTDLSMKSRQTLWVLMALCVALIEIPTWMSRRYRAAVGKDTLYVTPYWGKKTSPAFVPNQPGMEEHPARGAEHLHRGKAVLQNTGNLCGIQGVSADA